MGQGGSFGVIIGSVILRDTPVDPLGVNPGFSCELRDSLEQRCLADAAHSREKEDMRIRVRIGQPFADVAQLGVAPNKRSRVQRWIRKGPFRDKAFQWYRPPKSHRPVIFFVKVCNSFEKNGTCPRKLRRSSFSLLRSLPLDETCLVDRAAHRQLGWTAIN